MWFGGLVGHCLRVHTSQFTKPHTGVDPGKSSARRTTGVGCHLSAAHGFSQKPRTRRSRAGRRACHFFVRLPLPKPGLAGPVHHRRDTSLALLWTGHIRYCGFHPFLFFDRRSNMEYKQLATTSTVLRYEHPAINAQFARLIGHQATVFFSTKRPAPAISHLTIHLILSSVNGGG